MELHTCNSSTQKTEEDSSPQVQSQPKLHSGTLSQDDDDDDDDDNDDSSFKVREGKGIVMVQT